MKVHYINILLFSLSLNILVTLYHVNIDKKSYNTHHTQINRSLCECNLYMPNYDNDPEMKTVMENFDRQTSQRFHEYDERLQEKRQKCKEQCDKEIQKIILKDKLEKQMAQQLTTLETKINTNDIPTCVCEKSLADKVEKNCLRCSYGLGSVAPTVGLIGSVAVNQLTKAVMLAAAQKGIEEGVKWGIEGLRDFHGLYKLIEVSEIQSLINPTTYAKRMTYVMFTQNIKNSMCEGGRNPSSMFCSFASHQKPQDFVKAASSIADNAVDMAKLTETEAVKAAEPALATYSNAVIASIVTIVVIILVMVIIYLILRYRRKKKMKKKLQYIKLLEE
ncbi:rifin PIR protein,putative [Plasmodium sp. DRC-Itaito]|nr:rifin PIR protein,putative [Plasmodium sp. DRC-Itaito]